MYRLSRFYFEGKEGVEKDVPKALDLLQKASSLGYLKAINNLAYFYHIGKEGIEMNIPKAIELYEKALKLGLKNTKKYF